MSTKRSSIRNAVAGGALALLALPTSAHAVDLSFKIEPGAAIALTDPQSQIYGTGVGQTVKVLFGLTSFLDIGPSSSFTLLPNKTNGEESGIAWTVGAGLRLKRPHDATTFYGISPWLDADVLYVRTGPLNRPGFDAAVGLAVPVGRTRTFWVGPFVRYLHIGQPHRDGFDNHDAKLLTIGLSFEVGTGVAARREYGVEPVCTGGTDTVLSCPDRDNDSIPDTIDRCPEVSGPMENFGCPNYKKLVIKKDKLELKEKLYFAWDQATLEEASFPVLDEVVLALQENKGFRVQIEGHTDSTGSNDHNQSLSERRAETVLNYLASHGIAQERLVSKGFSSSAPTDTNVTVEGRENNRRVEFVVNFAILNDGAAK
jgi:outer membrane protein OmpA-like peptidoglycan-associated protein